MICLGSQSSDKCCLLPGPPSFFPPSVYPSTVAPLASLLALCLPLLSLHFSSSSPLCHLVSLLSLYPHSLSTLYPLRLPSSCRIFGLNNFKPNPSYHSPPLSLSPSPLYLPSFCLIFGLNNSSKIPLSLPSISLLSLPFYSSLPIPSLRFSLFCHLLNSPSSLVEGLLPLFLSQ